MTDRRRGRVSIRCDRGQVAGIEVLPFGILIFVAGTLLIVNLWAVVDTKFSADSAARESTRAVVELASIDRDVAVVRAIATQIAVDTMADHGRASRVDVTIDALEGLGRCARIAVTVRTTVPALTVPFLGSLGSPFTVRATHSEIVDPSRSGVDGEATCLR